MSLLDEIIKKHRDGIVLSVFVTPEAQTVIFPAGLNKWRKCLEIKVRSAAVGNKANKDIIKIIADFFNKSSSEIFIIAGARKRTKIIFIKNITLETVTDRLKEFIDGL